MTDFSMVNLETILKSGKINVKTLSEAEGLTGLLRRPPSMQRDLQPLSYEQISGFKLQPGRLGDLKNTLSSSHRKKKKRKDQVDGEGKFKSVEVSKQAFDNTRKG